MRNRFRLAARALAAVLVLGACESATRPEATAGSAGSADDTPCVGALVGTFDNVVVPPGATCFLNNSVVRGNVKALENSRLVMFNDQVGGSVEGDKAELVQMLNNTLGGNVQIKEGELPNDVGFDVFLCNNTLTQGNIQVEKMTGSIIVGDPAPSVAFGCVPNLLLKGNVKVEENVIVPFPGFPTSGLVVRGNQVAQNLQVFKNKGPFPKTVNANVVGENLQCFENDPPFVGGPNVAKQAQGQCF